MEPVTFADFETFYKAMVEAALYTSSDEEHNTSIGVPSDRSLRDCDFDFNDLTERAHLILRAHALSFWSRMWYYIGHEVHPTTRNCVELAGHDLWLTSQGHGAGFWDGDWPTYGDMLTGLSRCYPGQLRLVVTPEGLDL
jgi:hypothetical protein